MDILKELFVKEWQRFLYFTPKIISALFVLIAAVWFGRRVGKTIVLFLSKSSFSKVHKSFFQNTITWLFSILGLIIALNILGLEKIVVSLLAGGGITAVALGFAFRCRTTLLDNGFTLSSETTSNLALTSKQPFDINLHKSGENH